MNPADEMAAKIGVTERHLARAAAGSGEQSDQQLRAILENLQQVMKEDEPVERDDLRPGITSYLDHQASERKAIYDRLVAIENEMKRRGSRGFARYLVATLIGDALLLTWQSYPSYAQALAHSPRAAGAREGKMRAAKAIFAVLCFGLGAAFVTGAIYGLVRPGNYRDSTEVWIPVMMGAMLLLGSFLLLRRKA